MTVREGRVQVGKRGTFTLPAELRKRYSLSAGDMLTLLDLGGVFVLSPEVSVVSKIAREIKLLREEANISLEDLLQGLDDERRRLYQERYGSSS